MDAVLNWLWQGSVVALALLLVLRPLARTSASVRYAVCWAALLLVLSLPVVGWLHANTPGPGVMAIVPAGAVVPVPDAWWASTVVMLAAWAAWVAVHGVRFARALLALRRARADSVPFPARVEMRLAHWQRVRREGRGVSLVLSDAITSAAV